MSEDKIVVPTQQEGQKPRDIDDMIYGDESVVHSDR